MIQQFYKKLLREQKCYIVNWSLAYLGVINHLKTHIRSTDTLHKDLKINSTDIFHFNSDLVRFPMPHNYVKPTIKKHYSLHEEMYGLADQLCMYRLADSPKYATCLHLSSKNQTTSKNMDKYIHFFPTCTLCIEVEEKLYPGLPGFCSISAFQNKKLVFQLHSHLAITLILQNLFSNLTTNRSYFTSTYSFRKRY